MLMFYLLLLGVLALFTAYTRNFQRTLADLGARLGEEAAARLGSHGQGLRTLALLACWPATLGLGLAFVAWWKAVGLALAAFVILVPALGALTPRPRSPHYLDRIRRDLRRRIARSGRDVKELCRILQSLDEISRSPPT